ncbi:GNAT family N-acetyltransferase [Mariniplasma anaerobium]|uniref:N-acetyltransferase n=1 Tax=Mariniplasma anaerobium TaxID=2735436 RepID=A0A7U9THA3_9MOLU|nr:GNAT family N-acetyltransferase [Mariniplasma anaerobium]BCR36308.1 N-acetyltransferase [Mariniplasma anaerobium]
MIRLAKISDLKHIWDLRLETTKLLKQRGIDQWQYHLPDQQTITNDINLNEFYVYELDRQIIGMIAIKSGIEPTYDIIYDGAWTSDRPYLTIHRLAVSKQFLGQDIAEKLMIFAHNLAKEKHIDYIRIDTHENNKYAIRFFKSLGYELKGYIFLNKNHPGDPKRLAFDILL